MATYTCASQALAAYQAAGFSVSTCVLSLAPHFTGGNGCLSGVPAPTPSASFDLPTGSYYDFKVGTSGSLGIAVNFFRNGTWSISHQNSTFNNVSRNWILPSSSTVGDGYRIEMVQLPQLVGDIFSGGGVYVSPNAPYEISGNLDSQKQFNFSATFSTSGSDVNDQVSLLINLYRISTNELVASTNIFLFLSLSGL